MTPIAGSRISATFTSTSKPSGSVQAEPLKAGPFLLPPILTNPLNGKTLSTSESKKAPIALASEETHPGEAVDTLFNHNLKGKGSSSSTTDDSIDRQDFDSPEDLPDDHPDNHHGSAGILKTPPCGSHGRFYCSYKEDYPAKVVTEVSRYYKWPLEKLFRDLRQQVMPKLANDNFGGLVCDSITRVVRPGWAKNTNNRWLVVINTDHYQQFVTEVICRNGPNAACNFIPPCYQATCAQRYNTQKLLVIDPWNPYKGPFVSEFLFPSCCICYVPPYQEHLGGSSSIKRQDKGPYAERLSNKNARSSSTGPEVTTIKGEL